ncbi:hypothetical protein [Maricaulis sp.]|uniref:hypothetical protein n=1 Tax=Maricaulis sp. TaxID=1486257 RepID=UPI002627428C|nr:hypothetical protein [Maricaulis sp.]
MAKPETPSSGPHRPAPPKPPFGRPLGFAAGLGVGLMLWAIIALATGNMALGLIFGLAPGVAIGLGLQLTAKR